MLHGINFFDGKETRSELIEFEENLFPPGESKLSIFNNITKAILVEKFLIGVYKIYKKNPKYYNKLIEIESKLNYPFIFYSKIKKINQYDKLRLIWDGLVPFPKLSFFSFNSYFSLPQDDNNDVISDPDELQKILEIRKKIYFFLKRKIILIP